MELSPSGDVLALIRGSETWGGTRMEGEMLFPSDIDNYLGFAYNVREREGRFDFGLVYLKGNDNYLQANPHRDFNVSRTLYPEARANLSGGAATVAGTWGRFAVEVVGGVCHVYIGGAATPQMTFREFEFDSGPIGLQPRSVGGDVWVDNVTVRRIDRLSYSGNDIPPVAYSPDDLLTEWQVSGPYDRSRDDVARRPETASWRPFPADRRGAVVTGTVVDWHGPRSVAYFRTILAAPTAGEARLELSTVDDLAMWVNGRFHWFVSRQNLAWFDFFRNPRHEGQAIPMTLPAGANDLVVRVRGGVYASGGFFARLVHGRGEPAQ
jgi:hypothetical protein